MDCEFRKVLQRRTGELCPMELGKKTWCPRYDQLSILECSDSKNLCQENILQYHMIKRRYWIQNQFNIYIIYPTLKTHMSQATEESWLNTQGLSLGSSLRHVVWQTSRFRPHGSNIPCPWSTDMGRIKSNTEPCFLYIIWSSWYCIWP